jgi:hypothetical protein
MDEPARLSLKSENEISTNLEFMVESAHCPARLLGRKTFQNHSLRDRLYSTASCALQEAREKQHTPGSRLRGKALMIA